MLVTVLATHPEVAPSTRFRIHQFKDALARSGVELHYDFLFDRPAYEALRSTRTRLRHARRLLTALADRRTRLARGGLGDVVLVSREVAPLFASGMLGSLRETGVPIAYDVDDAVFLPQEGGSAVLGRIARPAAAFDDLCRAATVVLAGNDFLADFARAARKSEAPDDRARRRRAGTPDPVRLLPTVVDTARFTPRQRPPAEPRSPVVGWVGSHSTLPYVLRHRKVFQALARRVSYRLRIVSNAPPPPIEGVDVEFVRWTPDTEVSVFHDIDVGVYPLADDHWTRGKCGFKAIQYAACAIPVVASPVGVVRDIVVPEETGLWAGTDGEWVAALEGLLADRRLRGRMGEAGRVWIEDRYSLGAALPVLLQGLADAAGGGPAGKAADPPRSAEEAPCAASPAS